MTLSPALTRLRALIVKEFLALLKDPKSRTVLIGPPLIQLIVFGYAATFELKDIPYAVYNEDRGAVSRTLEAAFAGAPAFRRVATISSEREIAPLIDNREALLAIHIAPRFSERLPCCAAWPPTHRCVPAAAWKCATARAGCCTPTTAHRR